MQQNKPVILGIKQELLLWGFKTTVRDNRNGELLDGYIVVEGNEDYELDDAREKVKKEYAKQGYTVTACEFDDSNTLRIDGITEFRKLQKYGQRCSKCVYNIKEDSSVGLQEGCEVLDDYEEDGDSIALPEMLAYFHGNGTNCPHFEALTPVGKPKEDEVDFLGEIMSTLEDLDEEGAE
jgi:hypothetical protein